MACVLLVTVTKVESQSVLDAFREATNSQSSPLNIEGKVYHDLGTINSTRVYMVQSEMGSGGVGAASQTVRNGIEALSPKAVVMVGIAFGMNSSKQAIGDVLVSRQLLLYDLQRVGTDAQGHEELIPRGDKPRCSARLLNLCQSADLDSKGRTYSVHIGLVLSGDKLIDNIDFRSRLGKFEREAIGGEMEGAGLYVACEEKKVDWILIKAICDWADGKKDQDKAARQKLAAFNAAQFSLGVLKQFTAHPYNIRVTSPSHGASVKYPFDVEGTCGSLPASSEIWTFGMSGAQGNITYWPQARATVANGKWRAPVYGLGTNTGEKHFGVFVVEKDGQALVNYYLKAGKENSTPDRKRYPGIAQLTSDIIECQVVPVVFNAEQN